MSLEGERRVGRDGEEGTGGFVVSQFHSNHTEPSSHSTQLVRLDASSVLPDPFLNPQSRLTSFLAPVGILQLASHSIPLQDHTLPARAQVWNTAEAALMATHPPRAPLLRSPRALLRVYAGGLERAIPPSSPRASDGSRCFPVREYGRFCLSWRVVVGGWGDAYVYS